MAVGGNHRARSFFKQHGWDEVGSDKIEAKYTSRAAQLYRKQLEKDAAKLGAATGEPGSPMSPQQPGSASLWGSIAAAQPAAGAADAAASTAAAAAAAPSNGAAAAAPAAPAAPAAAAAARAPTGKPRLLASRKPGAGKGGGLGVKKITAQVDDSLFEQAPQEEAPEPAPDALPAVDDLPGSSSAAPAAPVSSRFNMDVLEEKKPAFQVSAGWQR